MVVAFVFIKGATNGYREVISGLEKLIKPEPEFGVRAVYQEPLSGEYDSVLKLEGEFADISKYVAEIIKPMSNVDGIKLFACVGDGHMQSVVRDRISA